MAATFHLSPAEVAGLSDELLVEWGARAIYLRKRRLEALEVVIANGVARGMRKRKR